MMGEVMGKRELKKIQARKKIMEAALQQFRENGFQTASVADIMKTADMGLGTFYNYFSSKEDILYCFLDSLAGQLKEHLMSLKEQSRAAILQDMFPSEQRATLTSIESFSFSVIMIVLSPLAGFFFSFW